jgi:hypothetical protein
MNACHICGVPSDAGYFDVADIKPAPAYLGDEIELARFELHQQYCGVLSYFAQYVRRTRTRSSEIAETPNYLWLILCNGQPRVPYLPTTIIRNPWGQNAFPVHLRLEEGCVLRFVVRKIADTAADNLLQVGGRLHGRYWYNTAFGDVSSSLRVAQYG